MANSTTEQSNSPQTSTSPRKVRRSTQLKRLRQFAVEQMRNRRVERFGKNQLAETVGKLLRREVAFIYNESFEKATEADLAPIVPADIYKPGEARGSATAKRSSAIPALLAGLFDTPLLTADGEQILFRRMNFLKFWTNVLRSALSLEAPDVQLVREIRFLQSQSDEVRSRIVQSNLRLVVSISRKFSNSADEFDELVSEGNMILLNAVDKFDYGRGFRFSTYATHSVQRHFYRRWKNQQRQRATVIEAGTELINELPAREEQEDAPGKSGIDLFRFINSSNEKLDDREQKILMERYGLGKDGIAKTLRQVADDLGISKERVRQLQLKAVEKLQQLAFDRRGELQLQ